MSDKLQEIIAQVKKDIEQKGQFYPVAEKAIRSDAPRVKDFVQAINQPDKLSIIAEIKRKSPSAGD